MTDRTAPAGTAAARFVRAGVASPCISVCAMDEATGLCAGCFRTLDEIAGWIAFSEDEKRAVVAALPARRAAVRRPDPA